MPNRLETPNEYRRRRAYAVALESVEPVETVLDRAVNWLVEHPRVAGAVICALALVPLMLDAPQ